MLVCYWRNLVFMISICRRWEWFLTMHLTINILQKDCFKLNIVGKRLQVIKSSLGCFLNLIILVYIISDVMWSKYVFKWRGMYRCIITFDFLEVSSVFFQWGELIINEELAVLPNWNCVLEELFLRIVNLNLIFFKILLED